MNIENIMSKNIIVGSVTNTLEEIATLMKKYDIGFLPIKDQKKIVGVITDRDIVVSAISNKCSQNEIIDKYITRNIITIDKNENVENAIELMGEKKVKRLVVTDKNKIVGIISLSDLINTNIEQNIIINNLKKLWEINRNEDLFKTEIDEFYL